MFVVFFYGGSPFVTVSAASLFVPPPKVTYENITYEYDCGISALYCMYGKPVYDYVILLFSGVTIPIMFFLYAYVYLIASKKGKENATRQGKKVRRREMKVTKTTAIVLLTYTLCFAPTTVKSIFFAYVNSFTWRVIYMWFANSLLFANSMMNPLIYAGRSREMRKEFKETFRFIICKVSSGPVNAESGTKAFTRRQSPKVDLVTTSSADLAARFTTSFENTGDVSVQVL
ncbi:sphingosine 1-phosphate receptor 1-like [Anneissia japonica]|uniref:sphingosine 1-phosphate receptor 1-like n=1 Tax=Anneissia japonica TaxID=1529436 RepID=UPI001425B483|nr:sphingosine 1-phosphate receptor 1-like [Anneissia japonica]